MEEFINRESFVPWIETQPKAVNDLLMLRAALRTTPMLKYSHKSEVAENDAELTLQTFRTLFLAAFILKYPNRKADIILPSSMLLNNKLDYDSKDLSVVESRVIFTDYKGNPAAEAALFAAGELVFDGSGVQLSYLRKFDPPISYSVFKNDHPPLLDENVFWSPFVADMNQFKDGLNVDEAFNVPLWDASTQSVAIEFEWETMATLLGDSLTDWSFWIDWYQRILDGRPQNWEMLEEIALIDPEEWDKGAEHVNTLITGIQARYTVKERAEAAQKVLAEYPVASAQMGHNNPPEDIEDDPFTAEDAAFVQKMLDDISEESESSEPDVSRLRVAADGLKTVTRKIAVWLAGKLDMSVDVIIKTLVVGATLPFAGPLAVYLKGVLETLMPLLSALENWLPFIGG